MAIYLLEHGFSALSYVLITGMSRGAAHPRTIQTVMLGMVTLLSVALGFCFYLHRARRRGARWESTARTPGLRLGVHLLLLCMFAAQVFWYDVPVASFLASGPLTLLGWLQTRLPETLFKPIGYVALLFFPHTIHQLFVFFTSFGLFSALGQLRRTQAGAERASRGAA